MLKRLQGDHRVEQFDNTYERSKRVLGMGDYIKSAEGLPLLDPVTKKKPENLARDYGDMCLAADGFAQVE